MSKSPAILAVKSLAQWFEKNQRVMPWRENQNFYRVWISEIMLQQTQVATVIPYYEKFLARFPSVDALAAAEESEVLKYWAGLGYYSRGRNLHWAAKAVVAAGKFPKSLERWLELPGVGRYTAGAVVSIVRNIPVPVLDGNVERVLSRIWRNPEQTPQKKWHWKLSTRLVEWASRLGIKPRVFNQAMMELGATLCTPRKPRCEECPVALVCRVFREGDAEAYPPPKLRGPRGQKGMTRVSEVVHFVMSKTRGVYLRKRGPGEWLQGLWDCLDHSVENKLKTQDLVGSVREKYVITHHQISRETKVWNVKGRNPPGGGEWIGWDQIEKIEKGAGFKRSLKQIRQRFL